MLRRWNSTRALCGLGTAGHARYRRAAQTLESEITEGILSRHDEANLRTLYGLRSMKARIVMDDFGTGYASLAQFARFALDRIRIDRPGGIRGGKHKTKRDRSGYYCAGRYTRSANYGRRRGEYRTARMTDFFSVRRSKPKSSRCGAALGVKERFRLLTPTGNPTARRGFYERVCLLSDTPARWRNRSRQTCASGPASGSSLARSSRATPLSKSILSVS